MPLRPVPPRAIGFVVLALGLALGWSSWSHVRRAQHLEAVSALPNWSVDAAVPDATAPTGYADDRRHQLVAGGNREAFRWIETTQAWQAGGPWRVRLNALENTPQGHLELTPSLYRAWFRLVAILGPGSGGRQVEVAARRSDPWLHTLLVGGLTLFVALRWNPLAGIVTALAGATVFPLAHDFAPGAPHQLALFNLVAAGGLLALVHGVRSTTPRPGFLFAGILGGLGNWLSPAMQMPLLAGIAAAAAITTLANSRHTSAPELPWRSWGLVGGLTSLATWLIEYAPDHLVPSIQVNHPAVAVTWIGLGVTLQQLQVWSQANDAIARRRARRHGLAGLILIAAWPACLVWSDGPGPFDVTPAQHELTATGPWVADSLGHWLLSPGHALATVAALFPLVVLPLAGLVLVRRAPTARDRTALAAGLGAAVAVLALAWSRLSAWSLLDGQLLVLSALVLSIGLPRPTRRGAALTLVLSLTVLTPGWFAAPWPSRQTVGDALEDSEVSSAIERDLAHWLNARTRPDERTVLTSPHLTPALAYYGGIRGLGTLGPENAEGDMAAIRIVSATSPAETIALLQARDVHFLVVPSWDDLLPNYVRIGRHLPADAPLPADTFMAASQRWALPAWLRPVPYPLPAIGGMDGASVQVLQRDDDSNDGLALARLAEFFLETGDVAGATGLRERLQGFSTEPGTLSARGQVEAALGDREALTRTLTALQASVQAGDFDFQPWDRRVSLAILLTQVKLFDPARTQLQASMATVDADALRTLTPGALLKFIALSRLLKIDFPAESLAAEARGLLPPDYRKRLDH